MDPRYEFLQSIPEGGYGKYEGEWYVRPPGCHFAASVANHEVVEHEDGTITVSPSILYQGGGVEDYHGYLERGVWRSA